MPPIELAKYIVNRAVDKNYPITNLKLLKILYLTNQDFYKKNGYRLLSKDLFEIWQHGPVIPEVYYSFHFYGSMPIERQNGVDIDVKIKEDIDSIIDRYLSMEPWELVNEVEKEMNKRGF